MSLDEFMRNLSPQTMLFMGMLAAGALLLLVAFALAGGKEEHFKQRLNQVKTGRRTKAPQEQKKINAKRSTSDSDIAVLDRLIKSALPRREELRLRLARAGFEVPLGRYLSVCVLAGLVTMALGLIFDIAPPLAIVFIGLIAGIALPHMVVGILGTKRQNKFIELFPDAIDLMVRGLKSGLPINESIKTASEEVPDPVGQEFRRVTDAVRLGTKLEEALWDVSERLDLQDFKFFTVSLAIQSETGGNLSETLNNLSGVLRGRRQLKLKVKAMSSEAKASAYIIGSLPFVVGTLIYVMNPGYLNTLFTDPRGNMMLALGGLMFLVGAAIMYKMVKFEI